MALVARDGALAFCTDARYVPCPPPAEPAEAGVHRAPEGWLRGRLRGSGLGRCLNAVREAEQEGIGRVDVVDTDGVVRRVTVVNLIHHWAEPEHCDQNYGNILPVWDRLFGTWYGGEQMSVEVGVTTNVYNQTG